MNEAQTKHDLIEPALHEAGWSKVPGSRLRLEFPISKGRLIGQGRRATPLFADYVLEYKNRRIGVVEAKARDVYYTGGSTWSEDYADRKQYSDNPTAVIANTDGRNGGFANATIVSE